MGGGRDHNKVIPLCPDHHRVYDPHNISIHANKKEFTQLYGTEEHLMEKCKKLLEDK